MRKITPTVPPMNLSMAQSYVSLETSSSTAAPLMGSKSVLNGLDPAAGFGKARVNRREHVMSPTILRLALICAVAAGLIAPASADTSCRAGQSFESWLAGVRQEAVEEGISPGTLAALDTVTFDDRVLKQDRGQPSLSQSFLQFADRTVSADRLARGRALLEKHAKTFARIEGEFGVPGPVIVAFWGLETDYGGYMGEFSSLRSLATLDAPTRRRRLWAFLARRGHDGMLIRAVLGRVLEPGDLEALDDAAADDGDDEGTPGI